MTYRKVSLDRIDLLNDQFQISYMANRKQLTESIRKTGLIHPIILRSTELNGHYQIVSGFRRVHSCMDLNMKQIDAIVYEKDELSDVRALLLNLHQTVTSRNLNLIEKSLILNKLHHTDGMEKETILCDVMPLLNLEPYGELFEHVSKLQELTDRVKIYIVENDVGLRNAVRFQRFSSEDQKAIIKLISPLKLGQNRLKEILTYIDEIHYRDEVSASEIIDNEIEAILTNHNIPTPQRAEHVRRLLKKKRFPKLVTMEKEIQKNLKQLKLPPEISLSTPSFLEGEKVKVEFLFKSTQELKKIVNKLSDISDQKELKTILEML